MSNSNDATSAASLPELTVAIISIVGGDVLRGCIEAMSIAAEDRLVVTRSSVDEESIVERGWRVVAGDALSVPERRREAVVAARSDVIVLIEDTSVPNRGWIEGIKQAFRNERVAAVGGPVRIDAALPARSIALACSEYGAFHPDHFRLARNDRVEPGKSGRFPGLPGNNFAVRRSALDREGLLNAGLIEAETAAVLREAGWDVKFEPAAGVTYRFPDVAGTTLSTRFRHGRLYAGRLSEASPPSVRVTGILKSPLLPFLLTARNMRTLRLPALRSSLLTVLPRLFLQQLAWSAGELTGYLIGPGPLVESWS